LTSKAQDFTPELAAFTVVSLPRGIRLFGKWALYGCYLFFSSLFFSLDVTWIWIKNLRCGFIMISCLQVLPVVFASDSLLGGADTDTSASICT